jgi:dCMP deaminase
MGIKLKQKYIDLYMRMAEDVASLSYAVRLKVGAVIVNDHAFVYGYNGMPSGWDNTCESKEYMGLDAGGRLDPEYIEENWPYEEIDSTGESRRYRLTSNPEVLHAETNAISKIARSPISSKGASLFITHAPCIECAKSIIQAEIAEVYFKNNYKNDLGLVCLRKSNILVVQINA